MAAGPATTDRAASRTTRLNLIILLLVAVPPTCTAWLLRWACAREVEGARDALSPVCAAYVRRPVAAVNALWLVFVDVQFYLISLIQVRRC